MFDACKNAPVVGLDATHTEGDNEAKPREERHDVCCSVGSTVREKRAAMKPFASEVDEGDRVFARLFTPPLDQQAPCLGITRSVVRS